MFSLKAFSPFAITPNFFVGCGRSIDIGSSLNKAPSLISNNDISGASFYHDWAIISKDLTDTIDKFEKNHIK
jgi:hypothetical protein